MKKTWLLALLGLACIGLLMYRVFSAGDTREVTLEETSETQEVRQMMQDLVQEQFNIDTQGGTAPSGP